MPKKKKTQLKPVARVFATTSIPKKAATVDPVDVADDDANDAPPTPDLQTAPAINTEPTASQPSPEEQFIIDWISKNQDRVEREIQRALKVSLSFVPMWRDRWIERLRRPLKSIAGSQRPTCRSNWIPTFKTKF